MEIRKKQSLLNYNTFGFDVEADSFVSIVEDKELVDLFKRDCFQRRHLILGGGSNILFVKDFEGLVIHMANMGISVVEENDSHIYINAKAGENWEEFVEYCINNSWAGVENLSIIPGNIGACSVQNIGAYGVEVKDVISSVEVFDKSNGKYLTLTNDECKFSYRSSIFKTSAKDKYIIVSVTFRLNKSQNTNTSYGSVLGELNSMGVEYPKISDVGKAISRIRNKKLPDPKDMGNAGSFFKNPIISVEQAKAIKKEFPNMPEYKISDTEVKLAAAWLIEVCGWKGKKENNVGVHEKQSVVLVHYGEAKGEDLLQLSDKIIKSVKDKFCIELEPEVNII
ncbi:MAG: UDP-N-acetylmuramate dehydrogenase [Hyphomicrobiales bacterium]